MSTRADFLLAGWGEHDAPDLGILARRGWLATAAAGLRDRLIGAGRPVTLSRGDLLFSHHDAPGGVFGLVSGGIGAEGTTTWHPLRLGHVFRPGDWLGHGPALTGKRRITRLVAMEPSRLLHIPLTALAHLQRSDPALKDLLVELAVSAEVLGNWIACDLLIPDTRRRIAAVLLRVTGVQDGIEPTDPRGFMISQAQLAEMANASRNYSNQTLATFSANGWIEARFLHVRILDVKALAAFAYGER